MKLCYFPTSAFTIDIKRDIITALKDFETLILQQINSNKNNKEVQYVEKLLQAAK